MSGRVIVLRARAEHLPLPDASIDAVVCDPPYNLSDSGKRDTNCLRRIVAEFALPDHGERDTERGQSGDFPVPTFSGAPLSGEHGTIRVDTRVGVPEGPVDLQGAAVAEQEVDAGCKPAVLALDDGLPAIGNAAPVEGAGCYVLKLADGGDVPFCDVTCGCFAEPGSSLITVAVTLPCAAGRDLAGDHFGAARWSGQHVRPGDGPGSESERAPLVLAARRAEANAVLCLDLRRRTGELRFTDGAGECDPLFTLEPAQPIGAGAGACGLAAIPQAGGVGLIEIATGGAFSLHFPWHEIKFTGQSRGFMGKEWDGWESPASFQRWCTSWARECLRVLRPGGYLLAFGGSRTSHRLTCGIEDAGFEIRDATADLTGREAPGLMWIYGSGMPKSRDAARAVDMQVCPLPGRHHMRKVPSNPKPDDHV